MFSEVPSPYVHITIKLQLFLCYTLYFICFPYSCMHAVTAYLSGLILDEFA